MLNLCQSFYCVMRHDWNLFYDMLTYSLNLKYCKGVSVTAEYYNT